MKDSDFKVPDQKELEKELNEYLGKKLGTEIAGRPDALSKG